MEIMDQLMDNYLTWLKKETTIEKKDDYHTITLPYTDCNNDYLQIYTTIEDDLICLNDDGYILSNLQLAGVTLSKKRIERIERICQNYSIQLHDGELCSKIKINQFSQNLHLFIQAMLRIDDMYLTSTGRALSYFLDDVSAYFDQNEVYYTQDIKVSGKSGLIHSYDFSFQKNKNHNHRFCTALNNANRNNTERSLFAWNDTRASRKDDSELIVLINSNNKIEKGTLESFAAYNIKTVLWNDIEKQLELFR